MASTVKAWDQPTLSTSGGTRWMVKSVNPADFNDVLDFFFRSMYWWCYGVFPHAFPRKT